MKGWISTRLFIPIHIEMKELKKMSQKRVSTATTPTNCNGKTQKCRPSSQIKIYVAHSVIRSSSIWATADSVVIT